MLDSEKEIRKKKRLRCLVFTLVFTVIQIAVGIVLTFTVMKVTNPKIRIEHFSLESSSFKNTSFDFTMNVNVTIRNRNWGQYKYPNSTMVVSYQGLMAGEAQIPAGKAKTRKMKRISVQVVVSSKGLPSKLNFTNEIKSGALTLSSSSVVRGKATVMLLFKRKKSGKMNCTMTINTSTDRGIRNLSCK